VASLGIYVGLRLLKKSLVPDGASKRMEAGGMKAVVIDGYGSADRLILREIEKPAPGTKQVVLRVRATSVNPIDWKLRKGTLRFVRPVQFPFILGFDVAGLVEEVGPGVTRWRSGDAVYASIRTGGCYAEYVAADESALARKPEKLSFEEAAAVPVAALTALQAFRDAAALKPGHRVLINGASGGVGAFAVQVAAALGGRVTGVTSTRNLELVRQLGAERVIDYAREDFASRDEMYDVVFDVVPNRSFGRCSRVLAPTGTYVTTVPGAGSIAWRFLTSCFGLIGYGKRCRWIIVKPNGPDLEFLAQWIEQGTLKPLIDRIYALEEIRQAHAYSESGRARGKIVIRVQ
jgi:NADPH:quinone reductase-like Zn-dependent oxidoreductase